MKHHVIKGKLCSVVKMHYYDRILFSEPTEILHHIVVFTDGQFLLTANFSILLQSIDLKISVIKRTEIYERGTLRNVQSMASLPIE